MEKKTVNFGIIGCGNISASHGPAVLGCKDARLLAVCDIIPEKAQAAKEKYGAQLVYTDYIAMLDNPDIDAICVCTPSGMHGDMVLEAAKRGKHALCEKPVEINKAALDRLIDGLKAYPQVKVGCVFQRRVAPVTLLVKQGIDSGKFGKLLLADAYLKYYRTPEYYKSAGWRATWELDGGGALMNQGVHGVDLIQWLAGGVESVYARCGTLLHDIVVEDTSVALLRYKNGAMGTIECTTSVYPAQSTRFELHFENGSIIFGDEGLIQWELKDGSEKLTQQEAMEGSGVKDDPAKLGNLSHQPLLDDLVDAILQDRKPLIVPAEARDAVDLILAIYESSKTGKEIQL